MAVACLCMLFKIPNNSMHPLTSELLDLYRPVRVTRNALNSNSWSFIFSRFNIAQYSRSFILATTKLWNDLPSHVVEYLDLQKFKLGANAFLLRNLG